MENTDLNAVENAWAREIEKCRHEVRDGKIKLVSGNDFLRKLRAWRPQR